MIHGHKLPVLIDGRSEIFVMSQEITREFNIGWKRADWKMLTANGNWSDLVRVAESMPINVHGINVSVPVFLAKSGSEQVILGRPWETYTPKCENDLDDGSCKITISAVDGSQWVKFVANFP